MNRSESEPIDVDCKLQRFAYGVAGPRDFFINLAINGVIAWWVFGSQAVVPLAGPESIFKMLLPMAFIESTLTTFFGLLNGAMERRRLAPATSGSGNRRRWFLFAAAQSLLWGVAGLLFALAIKSWLESAFPALVLSLGAVVATVGISSGLLAYVLHSRAVLKSTLFCLAVWLSPEMCLAADPAPSISEGRRDENGFLIHQVESPYQAGMTKIRALSPDPLPAGRTAEGRCRVVYVLPVEANDENRYGDGLLEVQKHKLHNKHRAFFIAPTFSHLPWYADHPTDPAIRQESYFLKLVVPFVDKTYPVLAQREGRRLLGFSKSGWGAWSLLLRHPDVFEGAAAWDAPLNKARPDQFGMEGIFATQRNFEDYRIFTLLKERGESLGPKPRLILTGYGNFRDHHAAIQEMMAELEIPLLYRDGPQRKHDWHSGWLPEAVELLLTIPR